MFGSSKSRAAHNYSGRVTQLLASEPDESVENAGVEADPVVSDAAIVEEADDVSPSDSAEPYAEEISMESSECLVTSLLRIGAASDRGQAASAIEKEQALDLICKLEASATSTPSAEDVNGTWELVYSSTQLFRSSPFFMAGRAVCKTPEEAEQYDWFCDMHRAALAISTIGKVRQIVGGYPIRMVSEFEVKVGAVPFLSDFTPFAYSGGWPVAIEGAIVSSADLEATTTTDDKFAWEIFMDTVEIKGSNIPLLRQVLDSGLKLGSRDLGDFLESNVESYTNPRPVFKTTYLNENKDIRISRDQDGKVFVYTKVSDETQPTDYSGTLPDLGIGKLLEGFNDKIAKVYL